MTKVTATKASHKERSLWQTTLALLWSVVGRIPELAFVALQLCFLDAFVATAISVFALGDRLGDRLGTPFNYNSKASLSPNNKDNFTAGSVVGYLKDTSHDVFLRLLSADALQLWESTLQSRNYTAAARRIWTNPSYAFFAFGGTFLLLSIILKMARVSVHFTTAIVKWIRRKKSGVPVINGRRMTVFRYRLYVILRYSCGYDACIRLALASVELVWLFQRAKALSAQIATDVAATAAATAKYGGGAHKKLQQQKQLWQKQYPQHSLWLSTSGSAIYAASGLPAPFMERVTSSLSSMYIMEGLLALTVVLTSQRLFHALVGVRPLSVPDRLEECPLCGACWRVSRRRTPLPHYCPKLLPVSISAAPAQLAGSVSPSSESDTEGAQTSEKHQHLWERPGDVFRSPDKASWLSTITYSWLNPLLNVSLISPFGLFDSPSADAFKDGGQQLWKAQDEVVSRLPPLPKALHTREAIDDPAWSLWQSRCKSVAESGLMHPLTKRGPLEVFFWWVTQPVRKVLVKAFDLFFLPPQHESKAVAETKTGGFFMSASSTVKREAETKGKAKGVDKAPPCSPSPAQRSTESIQQEQPRPRGLFHLFLQHPSGREFIFICVPLKIGQDALSVMSPQLVRLLVTYLREVGMTLSREPGSFLGQGLYICGMLIGVVLLQVLLFQRYLSHLYAASAKATSALKTLLLHQTLVTPLAYGSSSPTGATHRSSVPEAGSPVGSCNGKSASEFAPATLVQDKAKGSTGRRSTNEGKKGAAGDDGVSRDGEAVSLLTVDATNCGDCLIFLHNVWGHPLVIFSSLINMYTYVGWFSTLTTFLVLVMLVPVNRSSAARVRVAQQQAKNNGARLSDLTTAFTFIRTVKAMALEKSVMLRTAVARAMESEGTERIIYAEGLAAAQTEITTLLISLVCFGSYLLSGGKMDAAVLIPTMAALNVMRFPVWTFPHLFSNVSRGYNSMKRIEKYLSYCKPKPEPGDEEEEKASAEPIEPGTVRCDGYSFCWGPPRLVNASSPLANRTSVSSPAVPGSTAREGLGIQWLGSSSTMPTYNTILQNVSLHIKPGEFVVIQGSTGSGKSALLLSMLGELWPISSHAAWLSASDSGSPAHLSASGYSSASGSAALRGASGGFRVGGSIAYCAESPWLRNRTLRENIRMIPDTPPHTYDPSPIQPQHLSGTVEGERHVDAEEEQAWYDEVLRACALTDDIKALPLGDRTVVGEAGGKISGGQRARVAIARAVLRRDETDVFIFDDVLSALDVEVQRHIISEVFHGLLRPEDARNDDDNGDEVRNDKGDDDVNEERAVLLSDRTRNCKREKERKKKKTVIFATHVGIDLLMPDRVLQILPDGTVEEVQECTPTSAHDVRAKKASWKATSASSRDAKVQRLALAQKNDELSVKRAHEEEAAVAVEFPRVHGDDSASESEVDKDSATSKNKEAAGLGLSAMEEEEIRRKLLVGVGHKKHFTLFPSRQDLYTLFIEFAGWRKVLVVLLTSILMEALRIFMDNWMGIWLSFQREVYDDSTLSGSTLHHLRRLYNVAKSYLAKEQPPPPPPSKYAVALKYLYSLNNATSQFLVLYAAIGITAALFSFLRTRKFYGMYQKIADTLQLSVVGTLFRAPVSYFDRVPLSGLLNILGRDQEVVDRLLGESIQLIFISALQLLAVNCFNAARYAGFVVVVPFSILLFYHLTLRFLVLTKQVRSLEGKLHSRSVDVLKEAVKGAVTVRAYGPFLLEVIQQEMDNALDAVHVAANVGLAADRWVALRLELVSLVITATLAILAVCNACLSDRSGTLIKTRGGVRVDSDAVTASAAFAGLSIISSMSAARALSMLCRRMGMFQNQYVSCEQLLTVLRDVPQEVDADPTKLLPPVSSASGNNIEDVERPVLKPLALEPPTLSLPLLEVRHLSGKYQPHLPWVLRDVTFSLRSGECIGLIGRTGNGKSSIFNALLRLMDVLCGEILVQSRPVCSGGGDDDGAGDRASASPVQLSNALGLSAREMRRGYFELVSQEPLLLQGTCKSNLLLGLTDEEAAEFDDAMLWSVLQKVSLDELLLSPWSPTGTAASPQFTSSAFPGSCTQSKVASSEAEHSGAPTLSATPSAGGPTAAVETTTTSTLYSDNPLSPGASGESSINVAEEILNHYVQAGGANLSAGQRQLLCLARSLLRRPKVVLLDEVSSKVDARTDALIQKVIKEEMLQRRSPLSPHDRNRKEVSSPPCGVLLIAHRLETILALCDRVLVIEKGKCVASLTKEQVGSLQDLQSYL